MPNQQMTSEETQAVIALWCQQQASCDAPQIADIAETLNVTPEQAQQLLVQVRHQQRQEGWSGQARRWVNRHPLVKLNQRLRSVHPTFGSLTLVLFGLLCLIWSGFSEQIWVSFPISIAEKVGLTLSNAGLWVLLTKYVQSVYQDIKCRDRRP